MSKINRIRIVNLNYNNKSIRVDDELFNMDCQDTMMSLRNGGGKSVLVQMIMAPFINKKYRDLGKRKFESYFSSSVPTYIMVEWKLDYGAGYVMNGMMVRKREIVGDEDFASKLDIVNFIYEYNENNSYDIKNMPVVCNGEKGRRFESYANSKKLFEELKKNKNYKFNYYDMTSSSTSSAYFSKLMEYHINHREWENIIRKINQKESGLSELFTNAKNVTGLVKEWFIPAVEEKISKDDDRIKGFREIINKYIKNYKDNKSKIDKTSKMELFNKLSEEIKETVQSSIDISNSRDKMENEIANIMVYLQKEFDENKKQLNSSEEQIQSLRHTFNEIEYEESSLMIYNHINKYDELKKKCDEYKSQRAEIESELESTNRKINIYDCAQLHSNYEKCSKDLLLLEQKLERIKKENGDMTPRIENLGYTMRTLLEDDRKELIEKIQDKKQKINELYEGKLLKNTELERNIDKKDDLKNREGGLQAIINEFDKVEKKFNKNNNETFQRNIEKLYDETKLMNYNENLESSYEELIKEEKNCSVQLMANEEKRRIMESQRESVRAEEIKNTNELKWKECELSKVNVELGKRREMLKYVDLSEDYLFHKDKIVGKFNDKIALLVSKQREIKNAIEKEQSDIEKLETGKVMELSQELQKEFKRHDIDVVYGMEWLKKNERSEEENIEIIKNNPLLPYALIMSSGDIEKLRGNTLEVFTSSPIVIVKRESINEKLEEKMSNIVTLADVDFLVSFNKKLLNEEELKKLIIEKRQSIKDYSEGLEKVNEDIDLYNDKKSFVQSSEITKESYEGLKKEIEELKTLLKDLDLKAINISKDIGKIESEISSISLRRENTQRQRNSVEKKIKEFSGLMESYHEYKANLKELEEVEKNIDIIEANIRSLKKLINTMEVQQNEFKDMVNEYQGKKHTIDEKMKKYATYKNGDFIAKDREDIIAEYEALTQKITSTEKQLKDEIAEADKSYKEAQRILEARSDSYGIEEKDYIHFTYDIDEEHELKKVLEITENSLKETDNSILSMEKSVAKLESKIENLRNNFKEKFGTNILMQREKIFEKNYNEEKNKVRMEIRRAENIVAELQKIRCDIDKNMDNLKEYEDFKVKDVMEISIAIGQLSDTIGRKRRDLNKLCRQYDESINIIQREIDNKLRQNRSFIGDDSFSQPIEIYARLVDKPEELLLQIDTIVNSYISTMEKLKHDISLVTKEEESILDDLMQYISDINSNLKEIDNNSTINVCGKSRKMLNIDVSEWDDNKELYRIRLRDYFQEIRERGLKVLDENENIEDIISSKITSYNLYNEVVGVSTVKVKLFKIEEEKQRQISWDEVATNSGGEGFLSSFIILSSLLSYTRRNFSDVFSRSESGKVLIMDNPFAQTSSSHLLKPLMEMAKKSNTQLICFTGLGGESIYDRFDNIYVLNTKQSKLQNGTQYLRGEHKKGQGDEEFNGDMGDEYEYLESARTQITEQMRLF
ncbi:Chromosome segregation ATPase [Hathewaya proteolytica DSM 3090]|uniref:Chromosome segregation ATPase n=1 Tax=Hathewaya proteolytica DSM 3090 TaxID=1121331 RepID=A0A1M6K6Q6_9CLOT|nr:hypothetical protein [Hathewaya proteolytica]SHJ54523.1 Chromosome segregation ATPase [Hathewaya proteolytica DSM 3090]